MKRTIEAVIDSHGRVRLTARVKVAGVSRALVTVLDELPPELDKTTRLAEKSLAEDWLNPEEDEAWSHLK